MIKYYFITAIFILFLANCNYSFCFQSFNDIVPQDTLPPIVQSITDSCVSNREIIVIDDQKYDRGIKSTGIISNDNCKIVVTFLNYNKIKIFLQLDNITKKGVYQIKVIDSADNVIVIYGSLIPKPAYNISYNPSDTLFFNSTSIGNVSCDSLTIINHYNYEYNLDDVSIFNNIDFSISANQLPLKISANDSIKLQLCFSPKKWNSSLVVDSLFCRDLCNSRKLILASRIISKDVDPPLVQLLYDSCKYGREFIVTEERIDDSGIKSVDTIINDNCDIQITYINATRIRISIESIDKTKLSSYRVKVTDCVDHVVIIWGSILPYKTYNFTFNQPDTLFFKSTLAGTINCDSIAITNNTASEYIFNNLFVFNNKEFSISPNQLPLKIPANGIVKFEVCFSPQKWTSAKFIDSLFCGDACFTKKIILCSEVISGDKEPPLLQNESDSCGFYKEMIFTDEKNSDTGIKSVFFITHDNCNFQITNINSQKVKIKVTLNDITKKGTYVFNVIDSVNNTTTIEGTLKINSSFNIFCIPSDTLFIKPTIKNIISCDTLTIVNKNNYEYILNDLYIYRNIEFSSPLNQFPLHIPAMDSIKIKVCFTPQILTSAKYIDSLYFGEDCFVNKLILASESINSDYNGDSRCQLPLLLEFDTTENQSIIIYPNPVQNDLNISIKHNADNPIKILIFSFQGELVFEDSINSKSIEVNTKIDINNLNSGIYFIVTNNGQEYNYKKIMISR